MVVPARLGELANPPTNVLGTALFLSYIAVALYCSASSTLSLYNKYATISSGKPGKNKGDEAAEQVKNTRKRHIKIYAFLASISFAMLLFNILSFLIKSFVRWSRSRDLEPTHVTVARLQNWMLESSLFESFANELVRDGPSMVWTQAAILATWFWNIWMAAKASDYSIPLRTMLPYITLGQILPISFTASLFIMQLHLSTLLLEEEKSVPAPGPAPHGDTAPEKPLQAPKQTFKKSSLTIPTILLNASLLALPRLTDHLAFIPLVLFIRLLLLLPYSGRISLRDADVLQSISVSGGFVVANLAMMRKVVGWKDVLRVIKVGREAVKTVGWDAQIGALVYAVLGWGGGV